jgi:hypothetical protein
VWITLFLERKFFQEVTSYPFIVNWRCGLPTFCWCHISWFSSCLHPWKKSLLSLGILNRKVKHFMNLLFIYKPIKFRPPWIVFWQHNPNPNQRRQIINLFDKFDHAHSKFQGFVNQMCLVIQLHPHRYRIGIIQVGFISTLLLKRYPCFGSISKKNIISN